MIEGTNDIISGKREAISKFIEENEKKFFIDDSKIFDEDIDSDVDALVAQVTPLIAAKKLKQARKLLTSKNWLVKGSFVLSRLKLFALTGAKNEFEASLFFYVDVGKKDEEGLLKDVYETLDDLINITNGEIKEIYINIKARIEENQAVLQEMYKAHDTKEPEEYASYLEGLCEKYPHKSCFWFEYIMCYRLFLLAKHKNNYRGAERKRFLDKEYSRLRELVEIMKLCPDVFFKPGFVIVSDHLLKTNDNSGTKKKKNHFFIFLIIAGIIYYLLKFLTKM